jgi:hypothetical protein
MYMCGYNRIKKSKKKKKKKEKMEAGEQAGAEV